jgi:hypothetical protein
MQDGNLLKLVKSGEYEFWTKAVHALPSVPDFMPVCYGYGTLPAREGVDKAARQFVVMQNVFGAMSPPPPPLHHRTCILPPPCRDVLPLTPHGRKQPSIMDIKLGTRSYSLHDTPDKQA